MEGHGVAAGGARPRSTRAGAFVTLAGGVVFLAGVFLPLGEGRSLWVVEWRSGPYWVKDLVLYVLPPALIVGAGVVGLVAARLAQAAGGAAIGVGLAPLLDWAYFRIEQGSGVDWGTGWWALVLGAALSVVGGVILVVQTLRESASAASSAGESP